MAVKVSSRGRVTIAKEIREQLNLEQGAHMHVSINGDRVVLEKAGPEDWRRWGGIMKGMGLLESLMEDSEWERNHD